MTVMTTADLTGKNVMTQDGHRLGKVEALVVDTQSWQTQALKVELRREMLAEMNLKKRLFGSQTIEIGVEEVAGVSEAIILRSPLGTLSYSGGEAAPPQPE